MGLATIDPHSQIMLVLTEIQRFKNFKIYKEMYGHPDTMSDSVRMAIHFFVNFYIFRCCISVKRSLINTKLGDFVELGLHFKTMWINSC